MRKYYYDEWSFFMPKWYQHPIRWYRLRKLFRKVHVINRPVIIQHTPQSPNPFWTKSEVEDKSIETLLTNQQTKSTIKSNQGSNHPGKE